MVFIILAGTPPTTGFSLISAPVDMTDSLFHAVSEKALKLIKRYSVYAVIQIFCPVEISCKGNPITVIVTDMFPDYIFIQLCDISLRHFQILLYRIPAF
jgi:hypothetical protein